jgi:hypothetical protein
MMLMKESYNDIFTAVITGKASKAQQLTFNALLQNDPGFRMLYEQWHSAYRKSPDIPVFDTDKAFEKMRKKLLR